jgi:hypothetical protein
LSRRRGGESFKNFQATAVARVVCLPTGLEVFEVLHVFSQKLSIKVLF